MKLNLFIFAVFLLSIVEVRDNATPFYIMTLIASTLGLILIFTKHLEK